MNEPSTGLQLLIVQIFIVVYYCIISYKLNNIRDMLKEVKKLYGNSTICTHRNESYRADNKSSLRDETNNKDSKAVH